MSIVCRCTDAWAYEWLWGGEFQRSGREWAEPERHGQGELHQVDAVDTVDFLHDCVNF